MQRLVALHALFWLAAANAVGLWLATLLLWPRLNAVAAPLTYGRWVPLHLDLQLYGWCALPLVGLLLRWLSPAAEPRGAAAAVQLWSGALALGAVGWLAGDTGGKPFLEWSGASRVGLVGALAFLWWVLAAAFVRSLRSGAGWGRIERPVGPVATGRLSAPGVAGTVARGAVVAGLVVVPWILWRATDPLTYPPINPDSGGATGGSLLGSTLGIVAIFCLTPAALGLRRRASRWRPGWTVAALALHGVVFALLDHGDRSHHEPLQVAALWSVALWVLLLRLHLRCWWWPRDLRRWLGALALWGALLTASALLTFLPGVLERGKFTDVLVAHAHLAMAGMVTAFCVLLLMALDGDGRVRAALAARGTFLLWNGGTLLMVAALTAAGVAEASSPGGFGAASPWVGAAYGARWAAGAAMLAASVAWWRGARAHAPAVSPRCTASPDTGEVRRFEGAGPSSGWAARGEWAAAGGTAARETGS